MSIYQVFVNCSTGTQVRVSDIKPHPSYCRVRPEADVRAMATSLVNVGYFNPIAVIRGNGVFYCVDGHLRLEALRYLTVPQKKVDHVYEVPEVLPVIILPYSVKDLSPLLELCHDADKNSEPLYERYFGGAW